MSEQPLSINRIARDLRSPRPRQHERDEKIRRLRFSEGWTLQRIGDRFGISRERVRQIVGNSGNLNSQFNAIKRGARKIRRAAKKQYVVDQIRNPEYTELTNSELADRLGVTAQKIADNRSDTWHAADPNSWIGIGQEWEAWVSERLTEHHIAHERMPIKHPFDIRLGNGLALDVKSTSYQHDTGGPEKPYRMSLRNYSRDVCDYLVAVVREHEAAFVIPTAKLPKSYLCLYLETKSKWAAYRAAWHLLK